MISGGEGGDSEALSTPETTFVAQQLAFRRSNSFSPAWSAPPLTTVINNRNTRRVESAGLSRVPHGVGTDAVTCGLCRHQGRPSLWERPASPSAGCDAKRCLGVACCSVSEDVRCPPVTAPTLRVSAAAGGVGGRLLVGLQVPHFPVAGQRSRTWEGILQVPSS